MSTTPILAFTKAAGRHWFRQVTGVGPMATFVSFEDAYAAPSTHTIACAVTGTPPSACTFQVEGSLDGINWFTLTAPQDGTTSSIFHIADKPVAFLRITVLTYTAADVTTTVNLSYTRGAN